MFEGYVDLSKYLGEEFKVFPSMIVGSIHARDNENMFIQFRFPQEKQYMFLIDLKRDWIFSKPAYTDLGKETFYEVIGIFPKNVALEILNIIQVDQSKHLENKTRVK